MQLKTILISGIVSLVIGTAVFFMSTGDRKKIAVVDAVKLVNNYKMKTELEGQDEGQLIRIKNVSDSLTRAFSQADKMGIGQAEKQELYKSIGYTNNMMEQAFRESNTRINEAVWKRLNPLIDEYSKEHGFHLVVGANGMGSVLYNDAEYDYTDEVITYVNRRYEQNK